MKRYLYAGLAIVILNFVLTIDSIVFAQNQKEQKVENRIKVLLSKMTIEQKIGQMNQLMGSFGTIPADLKEQLKAGQIGSILNETDLATIQELQRIAVEEGPHGIPLMFGRDVIHGFKTIFPIPLGQAASWNPELVKQSAGIAAAEAASIGINWTFAPMMDITRDARWGRIAESLGEDPHLASVLATSMIEGFQGDDLSQSGSIASCAKHMAGYGAAEGGRDYNTASIPEIDLHNVYLPPFKAAAKAKAATFMSGFNDLNGVPVTASHYLLTHLLRNEWGFDGFVVSDWESISQLTTHGYAADQQQAALKAFQAGVNMDMQSRSFQQHLASLVADGSIRIEELDRAVADILRIKHRLGLFEDPYVDTGSFPELVNDDHREIAKKMAAESIVLLKNEARMLPIFPDSIAHLAILGPLADDPYEQLGTWIFDGDPIHSETPRQSIDQYAGENLRITFSKVLETTRSKDRSGFSEAVDIAEEADAVVLFLGEEAILSGEAHSRANIDLPGIQESLITEIAATGKPLIVVILAGRPIGLERVLPHCDALLFAWHPGTMTGPAMADILFGKTVPSGKLPVTFPKNSGQIPIYYAHKNTGKPPTPDKTVLIDDIPVRAKQWSVGNVSYYLDAGAQPMFPFGFGLSYTEFIYQDLAISSTEMTAESGLTVSVDLVNTGDYTATEVTQLYIRDPVSSIVRPVRELKAFQRNKLLPGEKRTIEFELTNEDLAYYYPGKGWLTEEGEFQLWVGGDSGANLGISLTYKP